MNKRTFIKKLGGALIAGALLISPGITSVANGAQQLYGPDSNKQVAWSPNMYFWVPVLPNQYLYVETTYDAANENAVEIIDHATMKQVWVGGNFARPTSGYTARNNTVGVKYYLVVGWHKNTWPNGHEPWHQSAGAVKQNIVDGYQQKYFEFGFEDSGDADCNDALAKVWARY